MDNHFTLSVIIPVYNCERFIEKAVMSVLQQPEVTEIVVVDDGSSDGSLALLKHLQQEQPRMHLYQHPNNANKGRSASRNLGIQKATGDYIAFLDADDYFLPNRFVNDIKVFQENEKCDGIYSAVGFHFYRTITTEEQSQLKLNTMTTGIEPDSLFDALISGKYGFFHIDGLTVKKSMFDATGLFNETLVVSEDSDLFWKMALKTRLVGGVLEEPVAKRGIHDANIFNRDDLYQIYVIKMYESLIAWSSNNSIPLAKIDTLLKWIWLLKFKQKNGLLQNTIYWSKLFFENQKLLFTYLSIKYFPIIRQRQILFPFLYQKN
ncbi:glycosyltransferase family 2 protein [Flavobacterium glaciei]|uniref:Glycosyltransferase involved in cell wall biosynthesis n=1 Tax=Flavobacterium glaciei TaxID=386300 RepID=A0A562Q5U4_9FLAO|nr:glycosyltransferase family A protein [Flavobacterium glaciei]RDI58342.1 glycosyltransferase involved in cell wall biosynthesis [Flavobacterium glaciei]TWI52127.1 glycosyltransferase involved in cell wall biosynthesis [Flavobacterium glaciei]